MADSTDIMEMDPTHLMVYSITGYGNQGDALFIPGAATSAAYQTIEDGNGLLNGTQMLQQVTTAYTGTPDDPVPGDDTPRPGAQYTKWEITKKMTQIASDMTGKSGDDLQKDQAKLTAWSNLNSLNDTMLQVPTGEYNNMNKALESSVGQDQQNLNSLNGMASSAVGNKTYAANLTSQVY